LVAKGKETFGDRDAIDEGAGRSVKISKKEAGGLLGNRTMLGRHRYVLQINKVGWIAADRQRSNHGEIATLPGAADNRESLGHSKAFRWEVGRETA
jgi:hypothetical protein